MKKITRALCVLLALILCMGVVSACHPKGEIALTIGEYKITSGVYACAILHADTEARNKVNSTLSSQPNFDSSKEINYLSQTIDGVPFSDWVKTRAINMCKELVYIQMKEAELGLKFDSDTISNAKSYASQMWNGGQSLLYTANGVNYDTFVNFYLNSVKIQEYFFTIYGRDGTNPAPEEDVLKSLYDNFDLTYYIVVSYKDSKGNLRPEADVKADKALFDSYAAKINSGEMTFEEVEKLWLAEQAKREEEEKKENNTSSNTSSNTTTSTPVSSDVSSNTSSGNTSSGSTSSEEPFSKPADENAYLIGSDKTGNNWEFKYFKKVHELEIGKSVVVEEEDSQCMLFVRGDIKADKYYEKNYYNTALSLLKYESFEADYQKGAHALAYTENKYATGNFSAKKVDRSEYEQYMKYMQYYGNYQ